MTAFVSSVGTGGTLAGTALYLKERNPKIITVCADPYGAAMWSWFTNGNTDIKDGDSFAEGIGQTRVTKNLEGIVIDRAYRIKDQTALTIVYQLLREEGLFLGLSSGINIAGAVRFAKERRGWTDHRHPALRFRLEISVQAFQSGMVEGAQSRSRSAHRTCFE